MQSLLTQNPKADPFSVFRSPSRKTSDHHLGDTEAIQFPRERNQIRVGRNAGYFPFRFRFAVHAVQASLLANLKAPFACPWPRANWAAVRCRRAKRCHGVFCNVPRVLMACFSTGSNARERPEGSSAAPDRKGRGRCTHR